MVAPQAQWAWPEMARETAGDASMTAPSRSLLRKALRKRHRLGTMDRGWIRSRLTGRWCETTTTGSPAERPMESSSRPLQTRRDLEDHDPATVRQTLLSSLADAKKRR